MAGSSKEIEEHLTEAELDEALDEAQSNDESYLVRRLCLIKNLYAGDSITEAAARVGVSNRRRVAGPTTGTSTASTDYVPISVVGDGRS